MKRLPEIGERVRYASNYIREWEGAARTLTGTVRRIYPGTRCEGDETDDPDLDAPIIDVRVGESGWEERWSAAVEVDEIPEWWSYPGTNLFAPSIAELEPES